MRINNLRMWMFRILDVFFISLSVYLAFFLRFDGKIPADYFAGPIEQMIVVALIFCLFIFNDLKLYSFSWGYVSTEELVSLAKGVLLSYIMLTLALLVLRNWGVMESFPRSTLVISCFLVFIFCGTTRMSKRIYFQLFNSQKRKGGARVLIAGAGQAGEQILRSILSSENSYYNPIGFVDDSPSKAGVRIHGLDVLGGINDISKIILNYGVSELIVALPSADSSTIKRAVENGRKAGLKKIKAIPLLTELMSTEISLRNLKEVQVEDLLGRTPVNIDTKAIEKFIQNKKVLITGAAGSIGSELSRQIAKFKPGLIILLDQDETGIFNISNELKRRYPTLVYKSIVSDIVNREKIERIFETYKPDVIFHAAAYKHVPLMEEQADEAVKNNIFGTKNVAESALKYNAEKFVLISTDKAVNPTSIMGATKRVCEMICQSLNKKGNTKFVSVRFGNVLDSRGSVIPIFKEQIRKRGPVEVTHPEMKRYFMLIPEACILVMQAGEMGQGGEVFVLDMGSPMMILDLAKEMIRLSGYEPDKDIPIVFTGMRPGEKLFEEILTSEEGTIATQNKSIYSAKLSEIDEIKLNNVLKELESPIVKSKEHISNELKKIIPFYEKRAEN